MKTFKCYLLHGSRKALLISFHQRDERCKMAGKHTSQGVWVPKNQIVKKVVGRQEVYKWPETEMTIPEYLYSRVVRDYNSIIDKEIKNRENV